MLITSSSIMNKYVNVVVTLFFLIVCASAFDEAEEAAFKAQWKHQSEEENDRSLQDVVDIRCSKWTCKKECRAQVPLNSNTTTPLCRSPTPQDKCFGHPIDYKYVPSLTPLPQHYEVLTRFPRCWGVLGPLLCSIHFRPCGVFDFQGRVGSKVTKMEVWQRFNVEKCTKVLERCKDVIDQGYFPADIVDCSQVKENKAWREQQINIKGNLSTQVPSADIEELKSEWDRRTVFTNSCQISYDQKVSREMKEHQCIFPLVYTDSALIKPVVDRCYLPCRTPLISSKEEFTTFYISKTVICCFAGVLCFAIFCFLFFYSRNYMVSHVIFAIAQSLFAFSVYFLFWGLGSIEGFAYKAECMDSSNNSPIRRVHDRPLKFAFIDWCIMSSFFQHLFLLVSIGFLAASFSISAAPIAGPLFGDENLDKWHQRFMQLRPAAMSIVYGTSTAFALIGVFFRKFASDGMSGVCTVGMHSLVDQLFVVALPGLAMCAAALLIGYWECQKEREYKQKELEEFIEHRLETAKKLEEDKEQEEFLRKQRENEIRIAHEESGALETLREEEEEEERHGEDQVLVMKGDEDNERTTKQEKLKGAVRIEYEAEWNERLDILLTDSISSRYTFLAVVLCMASMVVGLAIHAGTLNAHPSYELDTIKDYISCVVSKSFEKNNAHWLADKSHAEELLKNTINSTDPLERKRRLASEISIHGCELPSTGNARVVGVLFVFLVLPLLPLLVFIFAFFAGVIGYGGMRKVLKRRASYKEEDDEEEKIEMGKIEKRKDFEEDKNTLDKERLLVPPPPFVFSSFNRPISPTPSYSVNDNLVLPPASPLRVPSPQPVPQPSPQRLPKKATVPSDTAGLSKTMRGAIAEARNEIGNEPRKPRTVLYRSNVRTQKEKQKTKENVTPKRQVPRRCIVDNTGIPTPAEIMERRMEKVRAGQPLVERSTNVLQPALMQQNLPLTPEVIIQNQPMFAQPRLVNESLQTAPPRDDKSRAVPDFSSLACSSSSSSSETPYSKGKLVDTATKKATGADMDLQFEQKRLEHLKLLEQQLQQGHQPSPNACAQAAPSIPRISNVNSSSSTTATANQDNVIATTDKESKEAAALALFEQERLEHQRILEERLQQRPIKKAYRKKMQEPTKAEEPPVKNGNEQPRKKEEELWKWGDAQTEKKKEEPKKVEEPPKAGRKGENELPQKKEEQKKTEEPAQKKEEESLNREEQPEKKKDESVRISSAPIAINRSAPKDIKAIAAKNGVVDLDLTPANESPMNSDDDYDYVCDDESPPYYRVAVTFRRPKPKLGPDNRPMKMFPWVKEVKEEEVKDFPGGSFNQSLHEENEEALRKKNEEAIAQFEKEKKEKAQAELTGGEDMVAKWCTLKEQLAKNLVKNQEDQKRRAERKQ